MDNLLIESTESSIGVVLDSDNHKLDFFGESRPEDCFIFYNPILIWLENYNQYLYYLNTHGRYNVKVNFKFDYFNSTSAKYILDILYLINKSSNFENISISIDWYYRELDIDMKESGQEYAEATGININLINY